MATRLLVLLSQRWCFDVVAPVCVCVRVCVSVLCSAAPGSVWCLFYLFFYLFLSLDVFLFMCDVSLTLPCVVGDASAAACMAGLL